VAKKKTKKRRGTPPGVDPNQARRERLEARRRAKAEELQRRRKAERREKLIRRAVMLLIVVGLVWFIFLRTQRPGEIDGHELELLSESIQGQQHVTGTVQYDSTPPVSGSHAASPVPLCGTYGDQIPNEQFVHTLEHGTIGILYDPEKVKVSDVRRIEEIVAGYDSHVLSMPYPTMETAIAVTSWGEMMRLDSLDAGAVREYIDTFRQKGPEKIDCPMDADDAFQPEPAPTQSPDPSPSPDQTPGSDKN
jgi:Protein of unknown function (DUF3105)